MTDMATYPGAFSDAQVTWSTLKWNSVYRNVRRLQARIVKATQAKRWGKVKALQRLLTRSFSAKVLVMCQHFSGQKISWVFKVCS
jgi:RNA-directed DNA polymerase